MDRSELLVIRAALNSAHMSSTVDDLRDAYRELNDSPNESRLSHSLRGAIEIIDFQLIEGIQDEEEQQSYGENSSDEAGPVEATGRGPAEPDAASPEGGGHRDVGEEGA